MNGMQIAERVPVSLKSPRCDDQRTYPKMGCLDGEDLPEECRICGARCGNTERAICLSELNA